MASRAIADEARSLAHVLFFELPGGKDHARVALEAADEIERLRSALRAVVDDYPVAAGTVRNADPEMQGYGSIKAARDALNFYSGPRS